MDEALTDTYWLNIADDAPFGALIEHTNFIDPARYGGEHLLYVPKYVQSRDDEVWQMSDEEVREHWLSGIEALFPDFDRESVNWVETNRNPERHRSTSAATSTWWCPTTSPARATTASTTRAWRAARSTPSGR